MSDSTWKTGAPKSRSERIMWPTLAQITRQLGLVVLITAVWGGLFAGYLRLSGVQQVPIAAQRPIHFAIRDSVGGSAATYQYTNGCTGNFAAN